MHSARLANSWPCIHVRFLITRAALYEHVCRRYAGSNPLYLHGVLVPSSNNRYLVHADGTPFYWLGDTHWSGFSSAEHFNDTNNNTFDSSGSMFKEMVNVRAKQVRNTHTPR